MDSDFLMSRCCGGGFARNGGTSHSSSSAMDAVRPLGVEIVVKSSSNMDRGEIESESNRKRVAGDSPSRGAARALLAERGEATAGGRGSSVSNANREFIICAALAIVVLAGSPAVYMANLNKNK